MDYRSTLRKALEGAFEKNEFSPQRFYESWFIRDGHTYYFLFKKNLKVTNIQFPELLSLVSNHANCRSTDGRRLDNCQFMAPSTFKLLVTELIEEFCKSSDTREEACEAVAQLYSDILDKTIVVETLYGSCALFLPPSLDIDAARICAHAGYVHSCGINVFLRRVDKATKEELFAAIKLRYLPHVQSGKKGLFIVYAHEDFSRYDRTEQEMLSDGLDDVKIYVEKFHFGKERLSTVINEARRKFRDRLVIPDPGDYRTAHREAVARDEIDRKRTLWLVVDNAIDADTMSRSDIKYYIGYEQIWKNQNPHHLFEEDKPAWVAQTTIPHTLMGAMLNVSRPFQRQCLGERTSYCDPFGGSGTSLLEASRLIGVSFRLSDIQPATSLLVEDNRAFFELDTNALDGILSLLVNLGHSAQIEAEMPTPIRKSAGPHGPDKPMQTELQFEEPALVTYRWAIGLIDKMDAEHKQFGVALTDSVVSELRRRALRDRVVFYLALRTLVKNRGAWDRHSKTWAAAFFAELHGLCERIDRLRTLVKAQNKIGDNQARDILVFQDTYSYAVSRRIASPADSDIGVSVLDVRSLGADQYDVIVTDPPYGFNTDEDCAEIAKLYVEAIPALLRSLRQNGQIILCLPDQTFTGRTTASFIHKEFVLAQFRLRAAEMGREIVEPDFGGPLPRVYGPPYTWESERALRRAILHLRVL